MADVEVEVGATVVAPSALFRVVRGLESTKSCLVEAQAVESFASRAYVRLLGFAGIAKGALEDGVRTGGCGDGFVTAPEELVDVGLCDLPRSGAYVLDVVEFRDVVLLFLVCAEEYLRAAAEAFVARGVPAADRLLRAGEGRSAGEELVGSLRILPRTQHSQNAGCVCLRRRVVWSAVRRMRSVPICPSRRCHSIRGSRG